MHRAHKIALDPTNKQATALARAAGTARFAYNWALNRWGEQYQAHLADPALPKPSQLSLRRELNAIKGEQFPWMRQSTKCAPQEAIIALGAAFGNFFAGRARYPAFKKRGVHDCFRLSAGQFAVRGRLLRVPHAGWIRMREAVRFDDATPLSVTISRTADRWYASIGCDLGDPEPSSVTPSTVGVDLGVRECVVSDDTRHTVPRSLRNAQRSLKRAQQRLARCGKGSRNRAKARARVARLHARVSHVRADWLHKTTTTLARAHDRIVVEDLNVRGMITNHRLALSISDASFGEFRRQLNYKTSERGTTLIVADRWFPSSKLCSVCATKTTSLALHQREWTCNHCGTRHDRDQNAARNLAAYTENPAASSAVSACGAFSTATPAKAHALTGASHRNESGTRHQNERELV